jgi:hypothetical protein
MRVDDGILSAKEEGGPVGVASAANFVEEKGVGPGEGGERGWLVSRCG